MTGIIIPNYTAVSCEPRVLPHTCTLLQRLLCENPQSNRLSTQPSRHVGPSRSGSAAQEPRLYPTTPAESANCRTHCPPLPLKTEPRTRGLAQKTKNTRIQRAINATNQQQMKFTNRLSIVITQLYEDDKERPPNQQITEEERRRRRRQIRWHSGLRRRLRYRVCLTYAKRLLSDRPLCWNTSNSLVDSAESSDFPPPAAPRIGKNASALYKTPTTQTKKPAIASRAASRGAESPPPEDFLNCWKCAAEKPAWRRVSRPTPDTTVPRCTIRLFSTADSRVVPVYAGGAGAERICISVSTTTVRGETLLAVTSFVHAHTAVLVG